MTDFDPYLKWLGIRDSQRPPNHYRLLGLELYEDDPEVVAMAADRQMTHVRTFQTGPHGVESQRLMGELAEARRCLLNADSKRAYDLAMQETDSSTSTRPGFQQSDLQPPTAKRINPAHLVPPIPPAAVAPTVPVATIQPPVSHVPGAAVADTVEPFGVSESKSRSSSNRTRKKSGALGQIIGIVSGGAAAVLVAWLIISSGALNQLRAGLDSDSKSSEPDPIKNVETPKKSESKPSKTEPRPKQPRKNRPVKSDDPKKPNTRSPVNSNPKSENPTKLKPPANSGTANSNKTLAPWEEKRWPQPPESLTRPKSTLDKILQGARIAIARRDYSQAKRLWRQNKDDAQKIDPAIDLGQQILELEAFWQNIQRKYRNVKVGDKIDFRGKPVAVVSVHPDRVDLQSGNKIKTFPLNTKEMDRDLAASLSLRSKEYQEQHVNDLLAADFIHVDLVADGSSFFDSNLIPKSTTRPPITNNRPPTTPNEISLDPAPTKNPKVEIPETRAVVKSKKVIRDVYPKGYDRSSSRTDLIKVAADMLSDASTSTDPAEKYALLSEAVRIGGENGQTGTVFNALSSMDENFNCDYWKLAEEKIELIGRNVSNKTEALKYYDKLIELANEAHSAGEISIAIDFAGTGVLVAKKGQDQNRLEKATLLKDELKDVERLISRGKKALEDLKTSPDEGIAQLNAGNYFCYIAEDFRSGARHWQKSSNPVLVKIAEMELAVEKSTADNKEKLLADAWYELGKSARTYRDVKALKRAEHWYELRLESATGLEKSLIETKLKNINALTKSSTAAAMGSTIDLEEALFKRVWLFDQGSSTEFTVQFNSNRRVVFENSAGQKPYTWRKLADTYVVILPGGLQNTFSMTNPYELVCTQVDLNTGRSTYSGIGIVR